MVAAPEARAGRVDVAFRAGAVGCEVSESAHFARSV